MRFLSTKVREPRRSGLQVSCHGRSPRDADQFAKGHVLPEDNTVRGLGRRQLKSNMGSTLHRVVDKVFADRTTIPKIGISDHLADLRVGGAGNGILTF